MPRKNEFKEWKAVAVQNLYQNTISTRSKSKIKSRGYNTIQNSPITDKRTSYYYKNIKTTVNNEISMFEHNDLSNNAQTDFEGNKNVVEIEVEDESEANLSI